MINDSEIAQLIQKISQTKKYQRLNPQVVAQAVDSASKRYTRLPEIDRKARNILHQLWGAYYQHPPNFLKQLQDLSNSLQTNLSLQEALSPSLLLHSSSRERLSILPDFYQQIFSEIGTPESIVDHACGLNPLFFPWMNLPTTTQYYAADIDSKGIDFLTSAIQLISKHEYVIPQFHFLKQDLQQSINQPAQVAMFLKSITCLDHLQKDLWLELFQKQQSQYLIVSFAIKSIGGYEKGMKDFYSHKFETHLKSQNLDYRKHLFTNELAYVIRK